MLKRLLLGAMLALVLAFPAVGAGTTPQFAVRVVTAAGAVTVTTSDYTICINKTSGAATTVNLPASPVTGRRYFIKDCKGDAATNNITIVPNAGTIDGAANLVISANYGSAALEYMASKWVVLGQYSGVVSDTITITTPSGSITTGGAITIAGTYTVSTPSAIDYQYDGTGGSWTAASACTIGSGAYSCTGVAPSAAAHTVYSRKFGTAVVSAASGSFTPSSGGLISPAYFVATTGNDSNVGSQASPFLTLAHAKTAMAGGATKTTYIRGGTYSPGATLTLVFADSDTSYRGYPGETAIIDGGSSVSKAFVAESGAGNITWDRLTIQNYVLTGIDLIGDGFVVSNTTIQNLTSNSTNTGGIYVHFIIGTVSFTNNLIQNNTGPGIVVSTGPGDPGITGGVNIDRNIVLTTNTTLTDTGGIYVFDTAHGCSAIVLCKITNNIVGNYGRAPVNTSNAKGIYLDDNTSYFQVTGNQVYGLGNWGLQIHGGDHNTITNNVFDITDASLLGLYQESTYAQAANMVSNTFSNNIIYSAAADPGFLWHYFWSAVAPAVPNVTNNLYYRVGGSFAVKGPSGLEFTDTNPVVGDPLFVNVAARDYTVSGGSPALSSPVSWTQLVHDQGPH